MPNLALHIKVLDQVIEELGASSSIATLLNDNRQFAVLGAMGPDVLRYRPISKNLATALKGLINASPVGTLNTLSQADLQELFVKPFGGTYSLLFSALVVPVWPKLNKIVAFLDKMDIIAQQEDAIALVQMIPQAQVIQNDIGALSGLQTTLTNLAQLLGQFITLRPRVELNASFLPPQDLFPYGLFPPGGPPLLQEPPAIDPRSDRLHEFLRWHRSGTFAQNLLANAANDQQRAYALGWMCHVASSVTVEPGINNVTGGPYRTHWWRNRLVGNFVDSWTFGFYESDPRPTMGGVNGDNPLPHYDAWPSLCSANLQAQFNIAGLAGPPQPTEVPEAVQAMADGTVNTLGALSDAGLSDIADLLMTTVNQTYPGNPQIGLPVDSLPASGTAVPGFTQDNIKEAFAGAFAVYWFMTSGSGPLGSNPIGPPPATMTSPPSWVSSGTTPTPQQAGLDTGAALCALLLAIIFAIAILTGALVLGVIALIALMNTSVIDWVKVRDNLYWMRKMLVDAMNGLRDALVWAGLAYPPPVLLGMIDTYGDTLPATDLTPPNQAVPPPGNVPATRGVPLCRTNDLAGKTGYPTQMDLRVTMPITINGNSFDVGLADVNFTICPYLPRAQGAPAPVLPETDNQTAPTDGMINPVAANKYPNHFVEDAPMPGSGMLASSPAFPSSYQSFGNAVSNAVKLVTTNGAGLPNYNLDGDRGYGWQTWGRTSVSLANIQIIQQN